MFQVIIPNIQLTKDHGKFTEGEVYTCIETDSKDASFGTRLVVPDDEGRICWLPSSACRFYSKNTQQTKKQPQRQKQAQYQSKPQESESHQEQSSNQKDS